MRALILSAAVAVAAGAAAAADLAVIVENTDYARLPDLADGVRGGDLEPALRQAGFEVLRLTDATAERLQERFSERRSDLEDADRLIVVLTGHMVSDAATAWLLGVDALRPDAFTVGRAGMPLSALNPILADKPGAAILALIPGADPGRVGAGLHQGFLPAATIPQGVSVVSGSAEAIVRLLGDDVLQNGLPLGQAVAQQSGEIAGYGYLPTTVPFLPVDVEGRRAADDAAWDVARTARTEAALSDYLDRFPRGQHGAEARELLRQAQLGPEALAAEEEASLNLGRDARREIQRNLSILGYETRGVDGIFGRGTRSAIRDYQSAEGLEVTGYLSGNQVARLQERAAARQSALEAEARQRQEEADRQDSSYWRETGRGTTEEGLRNYLKKYPDGLFSTLAEGRLAEMERTRAANAAETENAAWNAARSADTEASYADYLAAYPRGQFVENANARLQSLREDTGREGEIAAARASEAEVLANPITRLLVERRLQQLGLDPGSADGEFDDETRKAIRRYQRARDLPVTGYVTQQTLVRMLAG